MPRTFERSTDDRAAFIAERLPYTTAGTLQVQAALCRRLRGLYRVPSGQCVASMHTSIQVAGSCSARPGTLLSMMFQGCEPRATTCLLLASYTSAFAPCVPKSRPMYKAMLVLLHQLQLKSTRSHAMPICRVSRQLTTVPYCPDMCVTCG